MILIEIDMWIKSHLGIIFFLKWQESSNTLKNVKKKAQIKQNFLLIFMAILLNQMRLHMVHLYFNSHSTIQTADFFLLCSVNPTQILIFQCSQIDISKITAQDQCFFQSFRFLRKLNHIKFFRNFCEKHISQIEIMKMGKDICSAIVNFLNLLILKKNNQKLIQMINDVRKSGLNLYEIQQKQNSDSDYDEKKLKRVQFEKKVASLLKDPILQKKEMKRLQEDNQKSQRVNKLQQKLNHFSMLSPRRQKAKTPRIKAEVVNQESANSVRESSNGRRSRLFLPLINGLEMLDGPHKKPHELKRFHKNYCLLQITEHLLTFNYNKIDRRI